MRGAKGHQVSKDTSASCHLPHTGICDFCLTGTARVRCWRLNRSPLPSLCLSITLGHPVGTNELRSFFTHSATVPTVWATIGGRHMGQQDRPKPFLAL